MQQRIDNGGIQDPPIFVIGTGRCGSTLLSNMLREHPAILSISEFFAFVSDLMTRASQTFPEGTIPASQLWEILSARCPKQNLLIRHGLAIEEFLYPYNKSGARFNAETGIPSILLTTLPHLTDEHDALFDEVQEFVFSQPPLLIAEHYQALFAWLRQRFKRQIWVERSGGSVHIIAQLVQQFPNAKFVHLVRDGRNCAISMSRHNGIRLGMITAFLEFIIGCDPYESPERSDLESLPDELYPFLPEHFDAAAFRNYNLSPALYGHGWSVELTAALKVLSQFPPDRILTLRFEDLLATPEQSLRELITFIDPLLVDEAWIRRAASLVHSVRSSWQELPAEEQALLEQTCQLGFQALENFLLSQSNQIQ